MSTTKIKNGIKSRHFNWKMCTHTVGYPLFVVVRTSLDGNG